MLYNQLLEPFDGRLNCEYKQSTYICQECQMKSMPKLPTIKPFVILFHYYLLGPVVVSYI